jgi:hypothetical protein
MKRLVVIHHAGHGDSTTLAALIQLKQGGTAVIEERRDSQFTA